MLFDRRKRKLQKELEIIEFIQGGIKKTMVATGMTVALYTIEVLKKI